MKEIIEVIARAFVDQPEVALGADTPPNGSSLVDDAA